MTTSRLTVEIAAPPEVVFAALADLSGYAGWLPQSRTYRSTVDVSDVPVRLGSTYRDHISGDVMHGEVLACEPPALLVFRQHSGRGDLDISIRYELTAAGSGTRLDRTGTIRTRGRYRLAHPIVVAVTKRENRRTLGALKAHLERAPS
jgi:uncharacterized protein YndB with AHSA1/START domain